MTKLMNISRLAGALQAMLIKQGMKIELINVWRNKIDEKVVPRLTERLQPGEKRSFPLVNRPSWFQY